MSYYFKSSNDYFQYDFGLKMIGFLAGLIGGVLGTALLLGAIFFVVLLRTDDKPQSAHLPD